MNFPTHNKLLGWVMACLAIGFSFKGEAGSSFGPLAQSFESTLNEGLREEYFGPLLYQESYGATRTQGIPFVYTRSQNSDVDSDEWDLFYPLLGYDRFGKEYRLQLLQFINAHGGKGRDQSDAQRFAVFPFYFQQRSTRPEDNYTAFLPFYGHMKNKLLRDEIDFVLWPMYVKTSKKDIITRNYLAPLIHFRKGNALQGWQVWPFAGWETKEPTTRTLMNGEEETIGGHRRLTLFWPFFFNQKNGIGTENPQQQSAFVPFYSYLKSPNRDSITAPWPLGFTITHDREKQYREYGFPWPIVVWANGEGKTTRRFWPLFGLSYNDSLRSDFALWPIFRYRERKTQVTVRGRHQLLLYLYQHVEERLLDSGETTYERWSLWPLLTTERKQNGDRRFQALALLEPILPGNESIERNFSHAWSIWRSEANGETGKSSRSFFWNLFRSETTEHSHKVSFCFGLVQYQRKESKRQWRLFFIPFRTSSSTP
ncbi:MAG: hypothetical protein O2964_04805 [Verrucomicrobia bacterium]|nr:hypothetical protein [Verrucomicrobiota bacterium]